jgi:hypothetical protein
MVRQVASHVSKTVNNATVHNYLFARCSMLCQRTVYRWDALLATASSSHCYVTSQLTAENMHENRNQTEKLESTPLCETAF